MKTLYEMRVWLQDMVEDTSDPDLFDSWINRALISLTDEFEFDGYTKKVTLTPDSNGEFYVPPAYNGMIRLYPESDEFSKFVYQTPASRRGNRIARPYYMSADTRAVDQASSSVTIANGDTAIVGTGSPFSSAVVGEPVRFGTDSYEYEIATKADSNNITVTPAYRGEGGTVTMYVNPAGQRRFVVYDADDVAFTTDVTMYYKVKPQTLYNDNDRPYSALGEAIEYKSLLDSYRNERYNVDAERLRVDLQQSIARALNAEATPPRQTIPEGLFGGAPPFSIHTRRRGSIDRR